MPHLNFETTISSQIAESVAEAFRCSQMKLNRHLLLLVVVVVKNLIK